MSSLKETVGSKRHFRQKIWEVVAYHILYFFYRIYQENAQNFTCYVFMCLELVSMLLHSTRQCASGISRYCPKASQVK
jgi:hypothetical protein